MSTIMVCGCRTYRDKVFVWGRMQEIIEPDTDIVISGGASGVDSIAADWCRLGKPSVRFQEYPADWNTHGKAAGPIRNQQMVDACDYAIVIWDGKSRGTKDSINRLLKAGKPFSIFVRTDAMEYDL